MPPKQLRNLSYQAPETPAFLQAFKAQVAGTSRSQASRSGSQLDDLLGARSSFATQQDPYSNDGDHDDDDLAHAQIVVLKDGKHLTREEAEDLRRNQLLGQTATNANNASSTNIAQAGEAPTRRKRELPKLSSADDDGDVSSSSLLKEALGPASTSTTPASSKRAKTLAGDGGNLEDVKQLLRQEQESKKKSQAAQQVASRKSQQDDKAKKLQSKNKAARAEKKKSGKGLSFSMDD